MGECGASGGDSAEPVTYFAPAERATAEALEASIRDVSSSAVMGAALRGFGGILMVLNAQRQIVAVNDELLRFLGCKDPQGALGLRPGEALGCVHAYDNPEGGCGTSRFCTTCGAAVAIVSSQKAHAPTEAECLLTARLDDHEEAFEFRVRAAPIRLEGHDLTVISLLDIRDQKRKESLESVFLHDLMNTASALHGTARLLPDCDEGERRELSQTVLELCERLVAEIATQQDLTRLESGRYQVRRRFVSLGEVRHYVLAFFVGQGMADGRRLTFEDDCDELMLYTDLVLLRRALTNLVKNALEATPEGGEVKAYCDGGEDTVTFRVWNAGAMAPEVAMRIFQRYFTTKGQRGRGLGTYGTKLIAERYLGGRVTFSSTEAEGTTFRLLLPREEPELA